MLHPSNLRISEEIIAASKRFRQGVVLQNVPLVYAARFEHGITIETRSKVGDGIGGVLGIAPYTIITSQTCDIQQPKRIATRPFIMVARVFDATTEFDRSMIGTIRKGSVGDLVPLTAPRFQRENELWVADLRVEAPIERSVLVGLADPIEGFGNDRDYLAFSRALGRHRGRAAIDDKVLKHVIAPLKAEFKANRFNSDKVKEVRVRCTPSTFAAETVELQLLIFDDADEAAMREQLDTWYTDVVAALDGQLAFVSADVHYASEYTDAIKDGTEHVNLDDMTSVPD